MLNIHLRWIQCLVLIPDSQEEERWIASIKAADVGALTRRDVLQSNTEHIKAKPTWMSHERLGNLVETCKRQLTTWHWQGGEWRDSAREAKTVSAGFPGWKWEQENPQRLVFAPDLLFRGDRKLKHSFRPKFAVQGLLLKSIVRGFRLQSCERVCLMMLGELKMTSDILHIFFFLKETHSWFSLVYLCTCRRLRDITCNVASGIGCLKNLERFERFERLLEWLDWTNNKLGSSWESNRIQMQFGLNTSAYSEAFADPTTKRWFGSTASEGRIPWPTRLPESTCLPYNFGDVHPSLKETWLYLHQGAMAESIFFLSLLSPFSSFFHFFAFSSSSSPPLLLLLLPPVHAFQAAGGHRPLPRHEQPRERRVSIAALLS